MDGATRSVMSGRPRMRRAAWAAPLAALSLVGATFAGVMLTGPLAAPASAASGPVSVTVTSSPSNVATGQAVAYTVTVTNSGSSPATGLTLTNTFSGVGPGQLTAPAVTTNTGTCTYAAPAETCTAASVGAGDVWTVTITGAVSAAIGATFSDSATVTGSESASSFTASATATGTVSQSLASGFVQTKLAGGLSKPIAFVFAPGGDIYIGEQGGTIVTYRNGAVLPTPVITLNVFQHGETGLLGMALDPNFASNGYLYVSYTLPVTTSTGTVVGYARLSRFTVVNGVASPTSEKVLYTGNQTQNPDGSSGNYDHAGNDVQVGPDGKLWWSVGDNVPVISNAQDLNNIYGKILRFNLDGSVPGDNPFVNVRGAVHLRVRAAQPLALHVPAQRPRHERRHRLELLGGSQHDSAGRELRLAVQGRQLWQLRVRQSGLFVRSLPDRLGDLRGSRLHGVDLPKGLRPRGLLR